MNPADAAAFAYAMDPGDIVEFIGNARSMLAPGETIGATWLITMSPEGAALGIAIRTEAGRAPTLLADARGIKFWLGVTPARQQDAAFAGTGIAIGLTLSMTTTNNPPRTYERTVVVTVRQR